MRHATMAAQEHFDEMYDQSGFHGNGTEK